MFTVDSAGDPADIPPPTSLADITERLFVTFDGRLDLSTIVRVVRHCHRELEIEQLATPLDAIERLAEQRLNDIAGRAWVPVGAIASHAGRGAR